MYKKGMFEKLPSMINESRALQSFAGKSVSLIIMAICSTIANFLLFYFAFKYLGAEKFGEYRLFFSVIAFSGFFHLGYIDGLFQYWMTNKESPKFLHIIHVLIISSFCIIWLFVLPIHLIYPWIIIPIIISLNLNALFNSIFIKYGIYYSGMLSTLLIHLVAIIYIYKSKEMLTVEDFAIVYLLLTIMASIVLFIFCFKKGLIKLESIKNIGEGISLKYFTSGVPILLSGLFFISFFNLDKILLAKASDSSAFGNFSMASSIISVLFAILGAPVNLIFSKLLHAKTSILTDYYNRIFFITFLCAIIIPFLSIQVSPLIFNLLKIDVELLPFLNTWILLLFPLSFLQLILFNLFKKYNFHFHFSLIAFIMVLVMMTIFTFLKDGKDILILTPILNSIIVALTILYSEYILINKNLGYNTLKNARRLTLLGYVIFLLLYNTVIVNIK